MKDIWEKWEKLNDIVYRLEELALKVMWKSQWDEIKTLANESQKARVEFAEELRKNVEVSG